MIILPAIDLKGGKCVRLVEGRMDTATVYDADPLAVAERWTAAGAAWIHLVDLDGALAGSRTAHWDIAERIAADLRVPVQFGGGIRSAADARELLDRGVARVVIGTLAVTDPEAVEALLADGADRVAIGLDARDGVVLVKGWKEASGRLVKDLAREWAARGAKRFVYTDVARDGTLAGPDVAGLNALAAWVPEVPITASGGISSLLDLAALRAAEGVDSAIVGKALYEGRFGLREAIAACR